RMGDIERGRAEFVVDLEPERRQDDDDHGESDEDAARMSQQHRRARTTVLGRRRAPVPAPPQSHAWYFRCRDKAGATEMPKFLLRKSEQGGLIRPWAATLEIT